MNLEQTLTDEFRAVADGLQAPPPPATTELAHAARRSRRRSLLARAGAAGLMAAAVVAAVVLAGQVERPTGAPQPTRPSATPTAGVLPTGAPPRLGAYVVGSTLVVDGTPRPGRWSGTTTAGDSAAAAALTRNGIGDVVLFHGGAEVARLKDTRGVTLSPDGTKAAWFEVAPDYGHAALVERDLATGRVSRLTVDPTIFDESRNEEAMESVVRVGNDGTVYYGGITVSHTWKPGSAPVDKPATGIRDPVSGFPRHVDWVVLAPDGRWGAWLTGRDGQPLPDDVDPEQWRYDGVTLQQQDHPDTRFTIELPISTNARALTWETSTDLLVTVFDDRDGNRTHFLRCSTVDRHCELAPTPR